jgi:hypothetical protein
MITMKPTLRLFTTLLLAPLAAGGALIERLAAYRQALRGATATSGR